MNEIFKFDDEVHAYQRFVRENVKKLGDLTIISEQLLIKDMEKGFIDILALDMKDRRVVVLELKNSAAGDDIVGQSIKYYDFLKRAQDALLELILKIEKSLGFSAHEVNLDPRIMLVVPDFSQQLLRSLSYVNNIEIDVVKFNAIQKSGYYEIVKEIYVPNSEYREDSVVEVEGEVSKVWNFDEYARVGIDVGKISLAKQLVTFVDSVCRAQGKRLDVYFYKDKITLMSGKKVMAHAKMQRKWFDNSLDVVVSLGKEKKVSIPDLQYNADIIKYDLTGKSLKMKCFHLPTTILRDIL